MVFQRIDGQYWSSGQAYTVCNLNCVQRLYIIRVWTSGQDGMATLCEKLPVEAEVSSSVYADA
jgi:hypothetical protein